MSKVLLKLVVIATLIASIAPVLTVSGGSEQAVVPSETVNISVPDPLVLQTSFRGGMWSAVTFEGAISLSAVGSPDLPSVSHPLSLDRRISTLMLKRSDPVTIPLDAPIVPSAGMVRIGAPAEEIVFQPYDKYETYPAEAFSYAYVGSTWEQGKEVHHYSVAACPFDYDPSSDELTMYRQLEIGIVDGSKVMPMLAPTRAVTAPASLKEGTVLLIISADPMVDDLEAYRQWSMEKGQIATLVKFSTVDDTYPSLDGPSSIWQYVHDSFFASGSKLKYVLLVGEIGSVPSRMVTDLNPYYGEPATLPADTYYACLGTTTSGPTLWNADGDGQWGEVGDCADMLADVYVSRIALSSDAATTAWVQKVINYELNPVQDGWGGRAGLFGSETHNPDDGAIQCNYLWSNYLSDVYAIKAPYYSWGHYGSTPLTYDNIRTGFTTGFSLVVYMGHGLVDLWSEGLQSEARWLYDTNAAASMNQGTKLPYITAMSCETNWFDASYESISEGFTENGAGGAIGYVGASRTTYGGIGFNTYYPGAPGIQEDVLRMISDGSRPKYHSAEILMEAKNYYVNAWGAYFSEADPEMAYNAWMEHNLLGPADTPIWTADPRSMTVSYSYLPDYFTNFSVSVKGPGGVALSGATVTVYSSENDKLSVGTTDSSGNVIVPFVIEGPQYGHLTVTSKGYRPSQTDLVLQDTTDPVTTVHTRTSKPDGANGWFRGDPELTLVPSEQSLTYYKWNGGTKVSYKGGSIAVPVGQNTLAYWSEDLSGNVERTGTFRINYDPDAPVMAFTMVPDAPDGNSGWFIHKPVLTVSLDDSPGSPQYSEYWWDNGAKVRCNGTIHALQGEHTLNFRSADEAGNVGDTVSMPLKVDSVVPKTTFLTGGVDPNELGWYKDPFTITLKRDDQSGSTFYRWDDGEWTAYKKPIAPLDGEHLFSYYSTDPNGNVEQKVMVDIRFDTTLPATMTSLSPASPDGKNGFYVSKPTLTITSSEPGTIMVSTDRSAFKEYDFPIRFENGAHTVEAYSVDRAGNIGDRTKLELKVDTTPDKVESTISPNPGGSGWYAQIPSVRLVTAPGATIYYSWEGLSAFAKYTGNLLPPVEEGIVVLLYYSEDAAGNKGGQSRISLSVDARAPTASLNTTLGLSPGDTASFDMSGSRDGIGVTGYWVDFGDGSAPQWYDDAVVEHAYAKAGTYKVTAKVRDQAGHESTVAERTVNVADGGSDLIIIAVVAGAAALILVVVVLGLILLRHRSDHHHAHQRPLVIHPHPLQIAHHHVLPRTPAPVRPAHAPALKAHQPQPPAHIPMPPKPPVAPSAASDFRIPEPPKPPTA